ncbi:MAG TPA: hypothetical protein VHA82_11145 [Ramlibacter sp.]|uniref:hypothetical protein n=1 Tax=Ramlibacter sp. TaxID=1917967 RepID=UPI002D01E31F|nr:hypothetical protein [Ramlibacter sp.]HVZ44356.1 hypothetical protein [Ramlibacter sp.]
MKDQDEKHSGSPQGAQSPREAGTGEGASTALEALIRNRRLRAVDDTPAGPADRDRDVDDADSCARDEAP